MTSPSLKQRVGCFLLAFAYFGCQGQAALAQKWSADLSPTETDLHRCESVVFLDGGKRLATAGYYSAMAGGFAVSEIRFWDVASGKVERTLNGGARSYFSGSRGGALAASPDGKLLAAAGIGDVRDSKIIDFRVEIWDLAKGEIRTVFKGFTPMAISFSSDGKTLAATDSVAGEVILWDVTTGKERRRLKAGAGGGWLSTYSHDGTTLVICGKEGLALANAADEVAYGLLKFDTKQNAIYCLAISPDSTSVALGGYPVKAEGMVADVSALLWLWRLERKADSWKLAGKERIELVGHKGMPYSVAFSSDGKLLASCDQNNQVKLWDVAAAKELATLDAHTDFVYDVAFSPDGKHLASVGRDSLKLWEVSRIVDSAKR